MLAPIIFYSYLCVLLPSLCHANTQIIVRFLDAAGYYKIKTECVKDVDHVTNTYQCLLGIEEPYRQKSGQFSRLIDLPDEAEFVHITIKKFEEPDKKKPRNANQNLYYAFNAQDLRHYAQLYKNSKKFRLGISIFNQLNPNASPSLHIEAELV